MDITGIQALEEATQNLEKRGVHVLLCDARQSVLYKLARAGLVRKGATPPRYYRDLEARSEERRGGQECVSSCRSRWSPSHQKQKDHAYYTSDKVDAHKQR